MINVHVEIVNQQNNSVIWSCMTVFRNESHLFVSKVLIKFKFSTTYRAIEYRHMCNTKLVFQLQHICQ